MTITIKLPNGEQAVIHGLSPLDFALAIGEAFNQGEVAFRTKESIESAVREFNKSRILS